MVNIAPTIARPTVFRKRTKRGFVCTLTWDDLLSNLTPYPTLIVPVLPNRTAPHALCVVDDLIFQLIRTKVLKLSKESLYWIFNDQPTQIKFTLHFETKESLKGTKVKEQYERKIELHP